MKNSKKVANQTKDAVRIAKMDKLKKKVVADEIRKEKESKVLNLISAKAKEIMDEKYKDDPCKPTFMISMMYEEKEYILTLIHSFEEDAYDYRQSAVINLETNLEETIEFLYNRTM